jgi:putative chitinase
MEITQDQLKQIIPTNLNTAEWCVSLNRYLPAANISTVERVAQFLAQTAHESGDYRELKENLNYSAQGLANTWPNRFAVKNSAGIAVKPYTPSALATSIQRNPEQIADNVYADRLGNGSVASGDGWRFCGRGLIQITGRDNYTRFAKSINQELDLMPAYLVTYDGAVQSACWFWTINNLNVPSDAGNTVQVTRIINGGNNGLDDRELRYAQALQILGA